MSIEARSPMCTAAPMLRSELHIVDADSFTRDFCAGRGIHLAPSQPYPVQPIEEALAAKSKPSGGCCACACSKGALVSSPCLPAAAGASTVPGTVAGGSGCQHALLPSLEADPRLHGRLQG